MEQRYNIWAICQNCSAEQIVTSVDERCQHCGMQALEWLLDSEHHVPDEPHVVTA